MFLRRAGLNSGDELEIETQKGIIILKKIENTEKKTQNI
jgi:bifunctional DNA-binding transcriptional regulator/antitoxin component of YhaV-PrlF toxin-antitoxin module